MAPKVPPQIVRQNLSESSLMFIPKDAVEGYQERIETGITWTLLEQAVRYHKQSHNIHPLPFEEALRNKIKRSIFSGFCNKYSGLSLNEQWELYFPITIWDNEKFATEEGKICFKSDNFITDDITNIIKKAVEIGDRNMIMKELKKVPVLRIIDGKMTELDKSLMSFKNLTILNFCGNFLSTIDASVLPPGLRALELQANVIKNTECFCQHLPASLLYLGLSRNLLTDECVDALRLLPRSIKVLDLSDNDIYTLETVLETLAHLPNLTGLLLAGNPCSVCAAYGVTTLSRLHRMQWLDGREVMPADRSSEPHQPHPDDLRSAYFTFTVIRVMSVPQPPKPDKGATATFHVELELPLLDSERRQFLMYRRWESLVELLPPPEDDEWLLQNLPPSKSQTVRDSSKYVVDSEASSHESDIYNHLTANNSREILHYTVFETNKIQWNKMMNFQEPAVKIFCPDLRALRDTFRTEITIRLVYSVTYAKQGKVDKKSALSLKPPSEQRVTLATVKCALQRPDWSQPQQHFHWDDSLGSDTAIHWGDGDLSILQYTQAPVKAVKGKPEVNIGSSRQTQPDNLTCHFGFGIDVIRN